MTASEPCESCGKPIPPCAAVNLGSSDGSSKHVCMACCNAVIAKRAGVTFSHPDFIPMTLKDSNAVEHRFQFNTRHLGDKIAIDAIELRDDEARGCEFEVIDDDPECDVMDSFRTLLTKMQRGLDRRHLEKGSTGMQIAEPGIVRARIGSDYSDGDGRPVVVIDGKEIDWDHFGHMLLTYEGWQFKMEIYDKSEER